VSSDAVPQPARDVREARLSYPATEEWAYFNTAAVGLASRTVADAYEAFLTEWVTNGLDYVRAEAAAENARSSVAALMGTDPANVALIPSVSTAAGFVAAQLGEAASGESVVIGEQEYSSNHFPWRQLTSKGYEVRQVPFRSGGLEPDEVSKNVDAGTRLVAFSGVQSATGHRSDIAAISALAREVGAIVFVDASQMLGAVSVRHQVAHVDVMATADHKFLMHAGRGLGYCYLSPRIRDDFIPINAGWRAGAVPFESFFGPRMELSPTASRFDNSISWVAAVGNEAALSAFDEFGPDTIHDRNAELSNLLRSALSDAGWPPIGVPAANQSSIVSVPVRDRDPSRVVAALKERRITCAARDGNLRVAIHFYNHEDDIVRLVRALSEI
jgi:cysteine desulfurase / selenocysteine lyase